MIRYARHGLAVSLCKGKRSLESSSILRDEHELERSMLMAVFDPWPEIGARYHGYFPRASPGIVELPAVTNIQHLDSPGAGDRDAAEKFTGSL